jgi:GH15 family glucan-1,4-alpha-glucosidase
MVATVDRIRDELSDDHGMIRRYRSADGLSGDEGCFIACTFWLAECLALQNRRDDAREVFERAAALANDLGLFSEEYDLDAGEMLGNFPQGLSHYSFVTAAVAIERGRPAKGE